MDIAMIRSLLWNALSLLIAAPIIAITFGWIIGLYFKAKEDHMMKIMKAFSEATTKALEVTAKLKDIRGDKK